MGGSGNKLFPILVALALAFVVVVFMGRGKKQESAVTPGGGPRIAPAPDADTGADTLRAMAEQMRQMREEAETERRERERLQAEQVGQIAKVRGELESRRAEERQDFDRRLEEMARRLGPVGGRPLLPGAGVPSELPIGSGAAGTTGVTWIEPLDGKSSGAAAPIVPAAGGGVLHDGAAPVAAPKPPEPAYTVPKNATLLGSTAMTALVGRVPIRGQVEDPFPFKVLVGQRNLAANGLELPGVFGMVFSGTAFGDWTLGCVRGRVDSVTFVFDDGTIRTVDGQGGTGAGGGAAGVAGAGSLAGAVHRGMGWISDRRGIPCVAGNRISNAVDYLGGRMLARGLETAGQAYARSQQTINTTPLGGYTSAVTGSVGEYALGQTVSGSADELAKFIADRQAQQFDVVYVDTGAEVAVHIDQQIPIDYEPTGRKLDHARVSAISARSGRGGVD